MGASVSAGATGSQQQAGKIEITTDSIQLSNGDTLQALTNSGVNRERVLTANANVVDVTGIDFASPVFSSNLTLEPLNANQAITFGNTDSGNVGILDLTSGDGITLASDITFDEPVILRSLGDSINTTGGILDELDDSSITAQHDNNPGDVQDSTAVEPGSIGIGGNIDITGGILNELDDASIAAQHDNNLGDNANILDVTGIDFASQVFSSNLTLEPLNANQAIAFGGTDSGNVGTSASENSGAGEINLIANSDITTGDIQVISNRGDGGAIAFNSDQGTINITTVTLTSASELKDAGEIQLISNGNITTGDIQVISNRGDGGAIVLTTTQGTIDTTSGTLTSASEPKDAGEIQLIANSDITIGDIQAVSNRGRGIVNSGSIAGEGGDIIAFTANSNLTLTGIINTSGNLVGGDISLHSTRGHLVNGQSHSVEGY
ncbi:MAG: hypothetical protein F6K47_27395 [Symploca sp. SIO2E6]|nr:hypothetical protein [Symploca sp. SIO2E6]